MEVVIGLGLLLVLAPLIARLGRRSGRRAGSGGLAMGLWMVFASAFDPPAKVSVEEIAKRNEAGEPDAAKDEPLAGDDRA